MLGVLCFLLWAVPRAIAAYANLGKHTSANVCSLQPLGSGFDDTDQVEAAIAQCGHYGTTVFAPGEYNITRKLLWDLVESRVELHGYLNFKADLPYWMDPDHTYRVIVIQSQSSWFVITGRDFVVDAHNTGGIIGNGQYWWDWYGTSSRLGGDGRPVALSLWHVLRGTIANFRIEGQPFWCNALSESQDVVYDGMYCNATNTNPEYFHDNLVPNTDGIDTFRSDNVSLLNFDMTLGDDCLAIKGNSTNIYARNITCHGGNGIAIGSLGQYSDLFDRVENVTLEDLRVSDVIENEELTHKLLQILRIDPSIQPNMGAGVYFKSWTGTRIGFPPDDGGGGLGLVTNVVVRNVVLDNVTLPIELYQTSSGHPGDAPSRLQFSNLTFTNWTGTATGNTIVDFACSPAAPCPGMVFEDINVTPLNGDQPAYKCSNVINAYGLPGCSTVIQEQ
ncbi:glycoside hydrolase family 28 protein [Postia placenta MAD-698-R-SB12]|uniref:galacturonan 1,4-alpha-galacturonidase n=1 Tax=Postia placenta MAD-698-R-SB12 TaxID=670580 RepID=A0A1X6MPJ1_9APHY|nr:glycoside hydrolase family 28 protein [Postia placenta MAD-698-R-SB12]OSX58334.1 glycoside hydrolase family 28 protein [Postia placenta MAD-698-R-SB12]